jgi:hypothetical protein
MYRLCVYVYKPPPPAVYPIAVDRYIYINICSTLNSFFGLKAHFLLPQNTTYRNNVNLDLTSLVAMRSRAWLSHSVTLAHKVDMLTVLVCTSNMLILTRFSWFREEMFREGPRIWCLRLEACKGDNSSHGRRWVLGRPRSLDASKLPAVSAEGRQFKFLISSGLNCACCLSSLP